jgi:hypothetical protein
MPSKRSGQLPQLPYLSHTNRELGLMLRGVKPLAYFLNVVASEFGFNIRYWRMFDRHVAAGRFVKREVFDVFTNLEHRSLFYALPGHEWRIDAMLALLNELRQGKAWSDDHERRISELLGYEDWQIDHWLSYRRTRRAGAWSVFGPSQTSIACRLPGWTGRAGERGLCWRLVIGSNRLVSALRAQPNDKLLAFLEAL